MSIKWYSPRKLNHTVFQNISASQIILDIGCGIRPQKIITPKVHICCDPYLPYLEYINKNFAGKNGCVNYVLIRADWKKIPSMFPVKSVDAVFLLDVIEHLEKKLGKKLLKKTEKIAKKQIIIYTPLGFLPQKHDDGIDAWGMKGGKFQKHKSGWFPEDFDSSWNIFAGKNSITTDNLGRKLEKPYGSFWAIKNLNKEKGAKKKSLLEKCINFFHSLY